MALVFFGALVGVCVYVQLLFARESVTTLFAGERFQLCMLPDEVALEAPFLDGREITVRTPGCVQCSKDKPVFSH